jgi:hypothetical protein
MVNDKLIEKDIGMIDEIIELCKNLTSMEAHAQASFKTTGDKRFLTAKNEVRKIRTKWLDLITKKNFGQSWCFNKHACESLMRLDEIEARFLSTNQLSATKQCSKDYEKILMLLIELNNLGGENDTDKVKSSA